MEAMAPVIKYGILSFSKHATINNNNTQNKHILSTRSPQETDDLSGRVYLFYYE